MPVIKYFNSLPPDVIAFSTTRHGGCSRGLYSEMNINRYCGDDLSSIENNITALEQETGIDKQRIIMPHQTHGTDILRIDDDFLSLTDKSKTLLLEGKDALTTNARNICIGVSTADCIPVILYDTVNHAAAAVHAGWRGTVKRITEKAVAAMIADYHSKPKNIKAVIGPGISIDAFEVGNEVYEEFARSGFDMNTISVFKNKWHINLPECNRRQLMHSGLYDCNIYDCGICTYNNSNDFFSARKLGINSGRIFTGIYIKDHILS